MKKLALDGLPDAVACAQYHYFSNALGGVKTEYFAESNTKAWVRYPLSRWIWQGAAICGIPTQVNEAMLYGWHGHNGVSLGNPRLGFVCTGQTVDGSPGLEGYYLDYGYDIAQDKRVRFAYDELTMISICSQSSTRQTGLKSGYKKLNVPMQWNQQYLMPGTNSG